MPRRRPENVVTVLSCSVNDVSTIASLLRTVSFKKRSWFIASSAGLRVCVEVGRSVQAHAFLQSQMFSDFTFNAPDDQADDEESEVSFEVDLGIMLECLNIFGSSAPIRENNFKGKGKKRADDEEEEQQPQYQKRDKDKRTAMRMSYAGFGHPLVLLLEEGGTVTRCEIITLDPEAMLDLPFEDEERLVKVIMKSEFLKDALSEFDPSCDRLTFSFTPSPRKRKRHRAEEEAEANGVPEATMRIEAKGNTGSAEMDFPFDRDVIEVFNCSRDTVVRNTYPFSNVLHVKQALSASTKTSIRMDSQGLMSLQFMMPAVSGTNVAGFVEFLCCPLDDA